MFLTVHGPMGAIIASEFTQNPALAFAIGLGTHFLLDAFPHGDEKLDQRYSDFKRNTLFLMKLGAVDGIISLIITILLFIVLEPTDPIIFFLGAFGGILPDIFQGISRWMSRGLLKSLEKFHHKIHNYFHIQLGKPLGFWLQLVFLIGILRFAFF